LAALIRLFRNSAVIAIFIFHHKASNQLLGHISMPDRSADCEMLKRAGYTPSFFEEHQHVNLLESWVTFYRLALQHQAPLEYAAGLPVQRNQRGQAVFAGLVVKEHPTAAELADSSGGFLASPEDLVY
jgi:hypothetical protein